MMNATAPKPTKTYRDENFPVASWVVRAEHRPIILAFYRFVRTADDVADDPKLQPAEKLAMLDRLEAALLGRSSETDASAEPLRLALCQRELSPAHALELIEAFRLDVRKSRYASWSELMDYCRLSAMPVGRFVLDVHGAPAALWAYSDPLCAALQVINHLQDCAADYKALDRVYIPLDVLSRHGASVADLAAPRASTGLQSCLRELAARAGELVDASTPLPRGLDWRLGVEVATIQQAATRLLALLSRRDPLSQRVHLRKAGFSAAFLSALVGEAAARLRRRPTVARETEAAR